MHGLHHLSPNGRRWRAVMHGLHHLSPNGRRWRAVMHPLHHLSPNGRRWRAVMHRLHRGEVVNVALTDAGQTGPAVARASAYT